MAKQFNIPFDESEEVLLENLKDFIKKKGYKSQKEWLKSKIVEDIEPEKTNKNTIKITGGKTRQESAFKALKKIKKMGCSKVLIHDLSLIHI